MAKAKVKQGGGRGKTQGKTKLSNAELDIYRAAMAGRGVKLTRKQAAADMERRRKTREDEEAARIAKEAAELVSEANERAKADVDKSLRGLVDVLEILRGLAKQNNFSGIDPLDVADIAVSHLEKHGASLEQALFQLSVYEGTAVSKGRREGWFSDYLQPRLVP